MRRARRWLAVAASVLVALIAGIALVVFTVDPRTLAERLASDATDRAVSIEAMNVSLGFPIAVELHGLTIANAPWGRAPHILTLEQLSAEIDPWSLLGHAPVYRKLRVSGVKVELERGPDHVGNWKVGEGGRSGKFVPRTREQFPTLIDFALERGEVIYRNVASALELRIGLDRVVMTAADAQSETRLSWRGSYNGTQATLEAITDSFDVLRRSDVPFGATATMEAVGGRIEFKGGLTRPLDFDGVRGATRVSLPDVGRFLAALGAAADLAAPVSLTGELSRDDLDWRLDKVEGEVAKNAFGGVFGLREGLRGVADSVQLTTAFGTLDLDALLKHRRDLQVVPFEALPIEVGPTRRIHVTSRVTADTVRFNGMEATGLAADLHILSGDVGLDRLSFGLAGGKVAMQAAGRPAEAGSRWTGAAVLDRLALGELARRMGPEFEGVAGALSADIGFDGRGRVVREALASLNGHVVMVVKDGRIARALVERISTDVRALFRDKSGSTALTCFVGQAAMENGTLRLQPMRLMTPDAAVRTTGRIELAPRRLDLLIETDTRGFDLLRLNVPLRVRGTVDKPDVAPVVGPAPRAPANLPLERFPAEAQALLRGNPCLR